MVYDYQEYRKKREQLLAGEQDFPAKEIWIMIYDLLPSIVDPEEEIYRPLKEESLWLFDRMLQKLDWDDDEEADIFFEALEWLSRKNPYDKLLGVLADNGVNFVEPMYRRGELTTVRDYLLEYHFKPDLADELAKLGVDMNKACIRGRTPAFLLAAGSRISRYESEYGAEEESRARAVEAYFDKDSMEALNADGTSAVHAAVRGNHFPMLAAMLRKGVNVNLTEDGPLPSGSTLLHAACSYCLPQIAGLLIEAGADDAMMNVKEETAAHIAASNERSAGRITIEDRVETLRRLKQIDIPGADGRTPLMLAQEYHMHLSRGLTPVLIEKGADVNRADNEGNTALLLHTRWSCDMDVIKAMVKAGCHVNARNSDGNTALHFAVKNRSGAVVRYLIKKGADYQIANEEQVTPLQLAVEKGLDEVLPFMGL